MARLSVFGWSGALAVAAMLSANAATAATEAEKAALVEALSLADVMEVIREEGLAYGRELEAEMFPEQGGAAWMATVAEIYATDRLLPEFHAAFGAELDRTGANVPAMTAFFASDTGRKAVALELSARRALLDEAVEEAARVKLDELRAGNDPRLALVEDFIAVNGLIDANVTGGLNASFAFYRGMSDAGGLGEPMAEDEILAEVWGQEDEIRAETEEWMASYLVMAYAPLSDDEISAYSAFSATDEGKALNAALFAGFGDVFDDVSYRLGRAVAPYVAGESL